MSLQREAILQRIRDLLLNQTEAGTAVYINKAEPDQGDELPIVTIYGLSETRGEWVEKTPVRFIRILKVAIEVKIAHPETEQASARMNALAEQIERIVLRDTYLHDAGGEPLTNDLRFSSMDLVLDADSKAIVVGLSLQLEADYLYESELEAPANVRALLRAHIDVDLPSTGESVDATDDVGLTGG